ncbi:CBO0543 family protein [Niallia nealsonii]|uniref:Uncharacterized protein n=1 Tax=Niallia nealsonii TaxID=115979 RepID=A0A2N0Z062_9BACI|nr:CBO0543 family protein [Niallia nealsonii]PKG22889.1 hypothetical protein CWS01_14500 [Niallia nealsonii]
MIKEALILIVSWIAVLFFIPKQSRKTAQISFLFCQAIAWIFEYIQVYFGFVEFPFREFNYATKMNFSLYYIVYPTAGVFFILWYPLKAGKIRIIAYYFIFGMIVPTYSFLLEKYSSLVHFRR